MNVEIDRFGRILIPKRVRDRLGLAAGTTVELHEDGATVTLKIAADPHVLTREADGLLVLHGAPIGPIDPIEVSRGKRIQRISSENES